MKSNRVYLITGATSDIGVELIKQLPLSGGDTIIAHYHNNKTVLEELQSSVPAKIICLRADFTNVSDIENFVEEVTDLEIEPTDIIHLPAIKEIQKRFRQMELQEYINDYTVQVGALFEILKAFLPKMARKKYGNVVLMLSSSVMNRPPSFLSNYVTNKYALEGLMKSVLSEYVDKGIRINALSPSMIETKFLNNINQKSIEIAAAMNPMKRNAKPGDVVPSIIFLLSDKALYINGANIPITGGSEY